MAAYALSAFCFRVSAYAIHSVLGHMGAILMSLISTAGGGKRKDVPPTEGGEGFGV